MGRVAVVVFACFASACAGVSGLGDYTIAPEGATGNTPSAASHNGGASTPPGTPGALAISPTAMPAGTIMLPYTETFVATGGEAPDTFHIAEGSVPPGLDLTSAGVLAGTPTVGGATTFTIAAADARGRTEHDLDIAGRHQSSIGAADNVALATVAGATAAEVGVFVFTIESGTIVGSTDTAKPALATGDFQPGSLVTLVNKGGIHGTGGAGGVSAGRAMAKTGGSGGPEGPGAGAANQTMHSGAGGAWAATGETATSNSAVVGGKGGGGGAAIVRNGQSLEWVGGNDAEHVKGIEAP